jgi:ubiquinone/menaquinone biosynthesis C-methylase UbiE
MMEELASRALHGGLRKRLNAWLLARPNPRYENMIAGRKRHLFQSLQGVVVEIGPGSGSNLLYYPASARLICIEPNPYMHPHLIAEADRSGITIEVRLGMAEETNLESESVDAVVGTLMLCSVADPQLVLREVLRILKPGGVYCFLEHVAAPRGSVLRTTQNALRPVWSALGDGCHPNRETLSEIEKAGFDRVDCERFRLPIPVLGPHIAGRATKRTR